MFSGRCFPLAVGTNATARRSKRTSQSDVRLGTAQTARNCRSEQESTWRCAISVLRVKLRHAPPRLYFRTDAVLFARRDDYRFIHSRKIGIFRRRLTFLLRIATNTGLRCSSKASLRLRRAQDTACRKFPDCNNLFFGCFRVLSHKLTPT
jgi:hypothetical protein